MWKDEAKCARILAATADVRGLHPRCRLMRPDEGWLVPVLVCSQVVLDHAREAAFGFSVVMLVTVIVSLKRQPQLVFVASI